MARQPRYVLPGHPQHVIQRGNNRMPIFRAPDDFRVFRRYLAQYCEKFECVVHAYVLMTNHFHVLLTPYTEEGIAKTMQSVGRRYVYYFNRKYNRTGTLWEGRYKATLLDTETYLLACYRYIELNPVRAGMVEHPGEYPWSSFAANALGMRDELVRPHSLYNALGRDSATRQRAYRALFDAHVDPAVLEVLRAGTQNGWVVGNARFTKHIEGLVSRRAQPRAKGGDRRSGAYRKINGV